MVFRLQLAGALALAMMGACATAAQAVEPDAPDRLMSRMQAVSITLQDELSGKGKKKLQLSKEDAKGLAEYYRGAENLIWVRETGLNEKVEPLRAVFKRADEFGLAASDYNVVDGAGFAKYSGYPAEWLADAELKISAAALGYAVNAQIGRVVPTALDKEFLDLKPVRPEAKAVLKGIMEADSKLGNFL